MSGLLKKLEKTVTNIAQDVTREVGHIQKDVSREVDKVWSHPVLDSFKTDNVIQLVSRSSGLCLQIVVSPSGNLVIDGMGEEGPTVYHAHWTIIKEGKNAVKLHNNNNYLAIINGAAVVGSFPPPAQPGPETRFRVVTHDNFVELESIKEPGRYVGIISNGQLKSALATGRENDADFTPKLIYSPQNPGNPYNPPKK
ncbi:hypothetical protein LSH36_4g09047 [Paralvinella palmiformis]|uniref:Uncharacterized protein n=1 Tax=Paralvinella palmiformis TaxID=53620 RepID=A0AAD9NH55_9ANNE|nr:hypothetical protein LSH36_4g09047 [Paralvinella palmiformis]